MPASPQTVTANPPKDPIKSAAGKLRWDRERARANGEVPPRVMAHRNFKLPQEDADEMDRIAAALGINRSEVARRAFRAFFANGVQNGNGTPP